MARWLKRAAMAGGWRWRLRRPQHGGSHAASEWGSCERRQAAVQQQEQQQEQMPPQPYSIREGGAARARTMCPPPRHLLAFQLAAFGRCAERLPQRLPPAGRCHRPSTKAFLAVRARTTPAAPLPANHAILSLARLASARCNPRALTCIDSLLPASCLQVSRLTFAAGQVLAGIEDVHANSCSIRCRSHRNQALLA